MRLFRRIFRRPRPPHEPLSDEAMGRLLALADLSSSPIMDRQQSRREVDALRGLGPDTVGIIVGSLETSRVLRILEWERRREGDHCRPGRCMALLCCSYECSQGRCPSIPAEFREPTP